MNSGKESDWQRKYHCVVFFGASCREDGMRPGGTVHRLNRKLKEWVNGLIDGPPVEFFNMEH